MSIRHGECPHGLPLATIEKDGWNYDVPNTCAACSESGWKTAGYRPGPPQETPGKTATS